VGQPEDKSTGYQMEEPMARLCLGMNDKTSQGWLATCSRDVYVPVEDEGWATTILWVATVGQPEDKSTGYKMEGS
jgi:hypothetical protein